MNRKPDGGPDCKRETLLSYRKVDVKPVVQDLHNLIRIMIMETMAMVLVMMFAITGFFPLRVPAGTSTKISITWRSTLEVSFG